LIHFCAFVYIIYTQLFYTKFAFFTTRQLIKEINIEPCLATQLKYFGSIINVVVFEKTLQHFFSAKAKKE